MSETEILFNLYEDSPYRYTCNRCTLCCHQQIIALTPYEVLRLAAQLGLSTGEVIARFTLEDGTRLLFGGKADSCVFLTPQGCSVHPGRPLACRLYPLGRYIAEDGGVAYGRLPQHPQCAGTHVALEQLTPDDTVAAFLDGQQAQPFIRASERYYEMFQRMNELFTIYRGLDAQARRDFPDIDDLGEDVAWNDVDAIVARFCARKQLTPPTSVDDKTSLHLMALDAWTTSFEDALRQVIG